MAEPDPGSMQVGPSAPQGMFCKANASVCSPQQHSKRRVQSSSKPGQPCSVLAGLNNAKYFVCSSWLYSSVTRSLAACSSLVGLNCRPGSLVGLNCRPGSHLVIGCQDCDGSS